MENIILYDKQANPVITFSDFNVLDDANQFISTAITISYNIFHLNTRIDIERADLEGLQVLCGKYIIVNVQNAIFNL